MTESPRKSKGGSRGSSGGSGGEEEEDEDALFDAAMEDVKPLKGRKAKPRPSAAKTPAQKLSAAGPLPGVDVSRKPQKELGGAGLDRNTNEKLRRGKMPIEARLDLHGMTQDEAFAALQGFLLRGYERGWRCVLVITGKGKEGTGVLKNAMPRWLEDKRLKGIVLQTYPAKQHHGGAGALYILLRRKRA